MDPSHAHCRPAPLSRPAAIPLFEPRDWSRPDQPVLPWASPPEVVDATAFVPAALRRTARNLAVALVETLASRRPLHQLEPWLNTDVLTLVERLRAAPACRRLTLKSLRVQHPRAEVLEVALHLCQSDRSRAAAMRLVRRDDRWRVTRLAIALDPAVVQDAAHPRQSAG